MTHICAEQKNVRQLPYAYMGTDLSLFCTTDYSCSCFGSYSLSISLFMVFFSLDLLPFLTLYFTLLNHMQKCKFLHIPISVRVW